MTTIATDGKTMAVDSQINAGGIIEPVSATKIFKILSPQLGHVIVGFSGDTHLTHTILDTIKDGTLPTPGVVGDGEFEVTILTSDGKAFQMGSSYPNYVECGVPNASGSGKLIALGAMLAGASPKEAVEIAAKIDVYTGGKINVMSFED